MNLNRRHFLLSGSTLLAGVSWAGCASPGNSTAQGARNNSAPRRWLLGAFNRPWSKWGMESALSGAREAGFAGIGLLSRTATDPLIGPESQQDYLNQLQKKITASGLRPIMASLRTKPDAPTDEAVKHLRNQVDQAAFLRVGSLMTFGVDKPEHYEGFYSSMREIAAYAATKKIELVLKPHGGGSGAAEEMLRCLKRIDHPNFKVWYDAGNIIHYTGKDPLVELEPIAEKVTGFCAKDCARQKGEVMIQLGEGKVDFAAVFARLKKAGFRGPIMLEGSAVGKTPEETTQNARANRLFLEKVLAAL